METSPSVLSSEQQTAAAVAQATVSPAETRNRAAAVLSVIPGLGHLYKGHILIGGLIFFLVGPLVLALGLFLLPATLGLSLVIPVGFMLGIMGHAFQTPDRRLDVPKQFRALEHGTPEVVGEIPEPGRVEAH